MDDNLINAFDKQYITEGGSWNKESCLINNKIETYSGPGSLLQNTGNLINELNIFNKEYNIKSIVDIPCGDFNYMKEVNLNGVIYQGFDISKNAINLNLIYKSDNISFNVLDATKSDINYADLIICKDLFLHLSFKDINLILSKIKCKYFAVSRYNNGINKNIDKESGLSARDLDISNPPFNFNKKIIKTIRYCFNPSILDSIVIYKMEQ